MANDAFKAPRGTYDILPPESMRWRAVTDLAWSTLAGAGYVPVETPIFEHTEVFERGVGQSSEVVNKQMYSFTDRGGRSLTLRPEGTAPVVRAVLEHGLERGSLPVKLAYIGPFFRQERPQKGRFRQFFQIGIEAIGSDSPLVDAEVIEVGYRFLTRAGMHPRLMLNSIGHPDEGCREGYLKLLVEWLSERAGRLAPEDEERLATNPLRTFDSKERKTIEVMKDAPLILDHLCDACRKHFEEVRALLDDLEVPHTLEPRLVRGLDYYTRTAFEFTAEGLGSQNAVGGGGRYDGLSESLGGAHLPGIGFALGVERILLAGATPATEARTTVYVVALGAEAARAALALVTRLRERGIAAELDLMGRGMKGQMKDAARAGARWAAIIGDDELAAREVTLKDMGTSDQERLDMERLVDEVAARLSGDERP